MLLELTLNTHALVGATGIPRINRREKIEFADEQYNEVGLKTVR